RPGPATEFARRTALVALSERSGNAAAPGATGEYPAALAVSRCESAAAAAHPGPTATGPGAAGRPHAGVFPGGGPGRATSAADEPGPLRAAEFAGPLRVETHDPFARPAC